MQVAFNGGIIAAQKREHERAQEELSAISAEEGIGKDYLIIRHGDYAEVIHDASQIQQYKIDHPAMSGVDAAIWSAIVVLAFVIFVFVFMKILDWWFGY